MPALSHWFHLTPADLDDMTFGEVDEYLKALKQIAEAQAKAKRKR